MKMSPPLTLSSPSQAFTLVEMLAVMTIVIILLAFIVPPAASILKGNELTQGSQNVSNQLGLARQQALTQNHPVEVRFYQYADPNVSSESVGNTATWKYRAIQSFVISERGVPTPLGKVERLPTTVIIDSGPTLSSLIGSAVTSGSGNGTTTSGGTAGPVITTAPQTYSIPAAGTNYNAAAFRFYPDGSTNLSVGGVTAWFFTMHHFQYGDPLPTPPPNFVTVQIDSSNGNLREFRP